MTQSDIELMWGDAPDQEEVDFLVRGDEQRFPRGWFASGHQMIYEEGEGDPKGWHFDESMLPSDMLVALRVMEGQGKAKRVSIRHGGKNLVYYWTLTQPRYYVLAHGTPSFSQIIKDPKARIGLAYGVFTRESRDDKSKLETGPVLSVLAVEEGLYRAGYQDEFGVPKPIELRVTGLWRDEFYAELVKHVMLMQYGRDVLKMPKAKLQYWAMAQVIIPSDKKVPHTGGGKTTYVYTTQSRHPAKDKWTKEYIESLYCGDDLYRLMFPLVIDADSTPRVPGGLAIKWCSDLVEASIVNQKQYTSPQGKMPEWGTKPKPEWFLMRGAAETAGMLNSNYVQSANGITPPVPPTAKRTLADDLKDELENKKRFFQIKNDQVGIKLAEEGLAVLENKLGLDIREVENNAMNKLEAAGARQQELIIAPF